MPGSTLLTGPSNEANSVSVLPTFSWQASENATNYRLVIARDNAFTNVVVDRQVISETQTTLTTPLDFSTQYFWRVRGLNGSGEGAWSSTWTFTTDAPAPPVLIAVNEVMASNSSTIADENGDFSDWIEIFNYGTQSYNLEGYGLSDANGNPFKWTFPNVSIAPGQYMLIWASGKNRRVPGSPLHTNYSISQEGEVIILTTPLGVRVDGMDAEPIPNSISRGRFPNGTGSYQYFTNPTPGTPNVESTGGGTLLAAPAFSVAPGFYDAPVTLQITHPDPGAVLRYTLDGSDPTEDSPVWSGEPMLIQDRSSEPNAHSMIPTNFIASSGRGWAPPIGQVNKATIVRVKAFKSGSIASATRTGTYLVKPGHRYTLPIVAINTDFKHLFDFNTGIYVPGVNYVSGNEATGNYYQTGDEWERPASLEVFAPEFSFQQNIGIRIHGNFTKRFPQKAIRLYARGEYGANTIDYPIFKNTPEIGFKRLILRAFGNDWGSALIRDILSQTISQHLNVDVQNVRPAILYLNGEYWGMHNFRERYDKHFVARKYDVDPENIDFLSNRYFVEEGDNVHYLAMLNFAETRDLSIEANFQEMNRRMDVDNYLDYFIAEIFVNNNDWPQNNIDFWRLRVPYDPNAPKGKDGRWRWMLYDMDRSFGRVNPYDYNMIEWVMNPSSSLWAASLFRNLLKNEQFKNAFFNRMSDQMNTAFKKERIYHVADSLSSIYVPEITEHINRWTRPSSIASWQTQLQIIKDFTNVREGFVRQHIIDHFKLDGTFEVTLNVSDLNHGHIGINTIEIHSGTFGVNPANPYPWKGTYFKGVPVKLSAFAKAGYTLSHWVINGAISQESSPVITMQDNASILAVFVPNTRFAPVLTAPANNSFGVGTNPTFTWQAGDGAVSYTLQVARDLSMNDLVYNQGGITTLSQQVSGLDINLTYYWWVKATNATGQEDYSEIWRFAPAELGAIGVPSLLTPANNSTNISLRPTLSWQAAPNAENYEIQLSRNQDFTELVTSGTGISTTSFQTIQLINNTVYFWRVRATRLGSVGEWSSIRQFTTLPEASSMNGLVGHWKFDEGSGNTFIDHSGLENNATIFNTAGVSWGPGKEGLAGIFNGAVGSYAFVPHNPSINITEQITISAWIRPTSLGNRQIISKSGPDGYELSIFESGQVEFRINRETNGSANRIRSVQTYPTDGNTWMHVAITFNGTRTTMFINGLPDNSTTYSTIVGINPNTTNLQIGSKNGNNRWIGGLDNIHLFNRALSDSEVLRLFDTELPPPAAPQLSFPENNMTGIATTPTLGWQSVANAQTYAIQLAFEPTFNDIFVEASNLTGTSFQSPILEEGSNYYWRVNATGQTGQSEWSEVWRFTTGTTVSTSNLVGYWKMDEGSGNRFVDHSGYGHDATVQNPSSLRWVPGQDGLALRMSGNTNSFGSVPHNSNLDLNDAITIAAWIRPNQLSNKRVISKSGPDGYELGTNSNGKMEFRFNRETNGTTYRLFSLQDYPTDGNTWIHVAVTFNGTRSVIYINGQPDNAANYAPVSIRSNTSALQIGARGGIDRWAGDIDELRLYNNALTAAEISGLYSGVLPVPQPPVLSAPDNNQTGVPLVATLIWAASENATSYTAQIATDPGFSNLLINQSGITAPTLQIEGLSLNTVYYWRVSATNQSGTSTWSSIRSFTTISGTSDPSLVGFWKMNEGSGNIFIDHSGKGNDATINVPAGVSWVTGVAGLAGRFTGGTGVFAIVPHNASINITEQITIAAWIRPTALSNRQILSKANPDGYELSIFEGGQVEFRINRESSGSTYRLRSISTYPTDGNTWMHVAATFDGTRSRIYINGVLDNTATYAPTSINSNTVNLLIGSRSGNNRWLGDLDEVMLYNKALTNTEIQNLLTSQLGLRTIDPASSKKPGISISENEEVNANINEDPIGFKVSKIYPNPVVDQITLELTTRNDKSVQVGIFDMKGVRLFESLEESKSGKIVINLSNPIYRPGTYVLVTNCDGIQQVFKFFKK